MNKSNQNRAVPTRRFIIKNTASISNKKRTVGISPADLTNAKGLTKGGIYENFKDKNQSEKTCMNGSLEQIETLIREAAAIPLTQ